MQLSVPSPHNLLQPCSGPSADIALGGGNGKADGVGNLFEVLDLKLIGEIIPECLQEQGLLSLANGSPRRCFLGELADDAEHVLLENGTDGHGSGVVIVLDVAEGGEVAVFHHPEGSKDHGDAEGAHRQAADGSDGIVPKDGVVFGLELAEMLVECLALLFRETNLDTGVLLEFMVEGEKLAAKHLEMVI